MIRNIATKCLPSLEKSKDLETVSRQSFQTLPMSARACIAPPERSTNSLGANSVPKPPTTKTPTVPLSTVRTRTIHFKSWCTSTAKDLSFAPTVDWYVSNSFELLSVSCSRHGSIRFDWIRFPEIEHRISRIKHCQKFAHFDFFSLVMFQLLNLVHPSKIETARNQIQHQKRAHLAQMCCLRCQRNGGHGTQTHQLHSGPGQKE